MASYDSYESPRIRRLRSDQATMERLKQESSVIAYEASGSPCQRYLVEFRGKGLARRGGKIEISHRHQVEVKLGATYPRTKPELRWMTPIFHPNISDLGMVCLGGFDQHWAPSLSLDLLCEMLWDMVRYHNYDVRSPYNRDAALWANEQSLFKFPLDPRPMRDLRAAQGRIEPEIDKSRAADLVLNPDSGASQSAKETVLLILNDEPGRAAPKPPAPAVPPPLPRASQPAPDILFID